MNWLNPAFCVVAATSIVVGCGASDQGIDFDPRNAEQFEPATDANDQQMLIDQMLDALVTGPGECWDASVVVGVAQPTGIVSQWQFGSDGFGNVVYRFAGLETVSDAVFLQAIGRFDGLPTALIETWTGGPEAFVLVRSAELVHVSVNPGGGLSTVSYGEGRGACL